MFDPDKLQKFDPRLSIATKVQSESLRDHVSSCVFVAPCCHQRCGLWTGDRSLCCLHIHTTSPAQGQSENIFQILSKIFHSRWGSARPTCHSSWVLHHSWHSSLFRCWAKCLMPAPVNMDGANPSSSVSPSSLYSLCCCFTLARA